MTRTRALFILILIVLFAHLLLCVRDQIPAAAWRIPIGQAVANPGGNKPTNAGNIDDGFWQGAPVGGIGAGTFSRSYRGNFERWHIKAGVHKYQNVPANQFAVFAQPEGGEPAAWSFPRASRRAARSQVGIGLTRPATANTPLSIPNRGLLIRPPSSR